MKIMNCPFFRKHLNAGHLFKPLIKKNEIEFRRKLVKTHH